MTALSKIPDMPPEEVEALLPWHAAGTLSARDARRVDEALARDPKLAKQYAVIQEEFAETIHLNESLGAPSARAMQRLFAGIDAEPARAPSVTSTFSARVAEFFASLSPRTLAYSAAVAALALLLQAGVIGAVLVRQQGNFQSAAYEGQIDGGARALVRFTPEARVSDITQFLDSYNASIVAGLKAGMFRIQFGDKRMTKDEVTNLMKKVEQEKIVSFVAPAQ
jgi:anti-sigma factor RsiW